MNECFVHLNLHPQAVLRWAASVGAYLFSANTALDGNAGILILASAVEAISNYFHGDKGCNMR